ncbi:hypothetical protein ACWDOP_00330 [Nocardia sp. NPDC003693]
MNDVHRRVLDLRAELWKLADRGQLEAPEGVDLDKVMREVDQHLHHVEGLLRTPAGVIRERVRTPECACAPLVRTAQCACAPTIDPGRALDAHCAESAAHPAHAQSGHEGSGAHFEIRSAHDAHPSSTATQPRGGAVRTQQNRRPGPFTGELIAAEALSLARAVRARGRSKQPLRVLTRIYIAKSQGMSNNDIAENHVGLPHSTVDRAVAAAVAASAD